MTLFDLCMISIILNFILKIKANINIYKAFANKGYLFNNKTLKETVRSELEQESMLTELMYELTPIIPFYNLLITAVEEMEYCTYTEDYIENFREFFIIEKMTEQEKEEYSKNKTGLHALLMRRKLNKKRKDTAVVACHGGNSIWFDYDYEKVEEGNLLDSIVIIESRGEFEKKSEEELRQMVCNSHFTVASAILNTYDDPEKFLDKYEKQKNISLSLEDKKTTIPPTVQESLAEPPKVSNGVKKRIRRRKEHE